MTQTINWRGISYINGALLLALSFTMMIPVFFDFVIFKEDQINGFCISFFISFVTGGALFLGNRSSQKMILGMREAFLITSIVWFVLSFFSAMPFFMTINELTFTDACFESVSAITTTGTTILKNIETLPKTILLWRAILQWFGGIGIIVIAMSFFPALRLGGMQLFRSEFSDKYEKILPKVSQISISLLACYTGLTLLCAILFNIFGMGPFDAICHAMCTISTGGLSNYSDALMHFNSIAIETIASFFMIIGGITLMLFVRMFYGKWTIIFKDVQFRAFIKLIFVASFIIILWLWYVEENGILESMRHSIFNVISAITTTGYSNNTQNWSSFACMILFVLGCVGGCTGSTTGGIKIFRIQVLFEVAVNHMRQLRRPNMVLIPKFQSQKITEAVAFSVFTLVVLYMFALIFLTLLLSACGFDFLKGLYSSGSVLSNVGTAIVPLLEQKVLTTPAKYILMTGMICGRLELLTVLILCMPSFWKN